MPYWKTPIYRFKKGHDFILIDVTSSLSAGLQAKELVAEIIPYLRQNEVSSILDFGAGALRHCFPLIDEGFNVCAVEFEEQFKNSHCSEALELAKSSPNFSSLVFPKDFKASEEKFDMVMLLYVLQTMPVPKERDYLLKLLKRKLKNKSYILYFSRYNQLNPEQKKNTISDGYFLSPKRELKSFYRDFTFKETDDFFEKHGFKRVQTYSKRGTEQSYLYARGKSIWI